MFGKVMKAHPIATPSLTFAVKSIPRKNITNEDNVRKESEILRKLDHPNVVKF